MDKQNRQNSVVRAIIINDEGKVLLGKRARESGKNKFALIGGRPEQGESILDAVIREVEEELGISFLNPSLWKEERDAVSVPGEVWQVYYFVGNGKGKINLKLDEILETAYVDIKGLSDLDIAFDHKDILTQFFSEQK